MSKASKTFGMSDDELRQMIKADAEVNAQLDQAMRDEVVPAAKQMAIATGAVDSGKYAASIKVVRKAKKGKGAIRATDFKAAWIEFGTGEPGPTKAFSVMQKTAEQFGGNLDSGIDINSED